MADPGSFKKIAFLRSLKSARAEGVGAEVPANRSLDTTNENNPTPESEAQRPTVARQLEADAVTAKARARSIPAPSAIAATASVLPALPKRARKRSSYSTTISFFLCVVLPAIIVGIYYLGIASNQYVTSFHYAVRDSTTAANAGTGQSASGLFGVFGVSAAPNSDDNYIVADYITSRQAVEDLEAQIGLVKRYSRADVDWIARFNADQPFEKFVNYWKRMVTANYDQVTGISIAEVRAFTPEDAYLITSELAKLAEKLINEVANKPQWDAVRFNESELKRYEDRLKAARAETTKFRNSERLIDPQASVVTSNVLLAQTLRQNLTQLQTELSTPDKRNLSASSPVIQTLKDRIKATRDQLTEVEGQVANVRDGNTPLSKVVVEFEQLELERQFAQTMVTTAMQNLEQARSTALAQHVYVTPYVKAMVPHSSTYPKRYLSIAIATFCLFLLWLVGLLVARSIREHLV